MGVKRLAENAAALIAAGRDPEEPAAAIERGTWPGQRTVAATLGTIAEAVEREEVKAPGADRRRRGRRRREQLAWLERRPLHGRRVVVTRARAQASGLAATLRDLGAEVVELPAIRIEPRIESEEVRRVAGAIGDYALDLPDQPQRRPPALRGDGSRRPRRAGAGRRHRRRDRPRHRARAGRARHRSPTSSPSASSPRRWSRRWRTSRSRAPASSSPAPPRPATSSPTPCASAAPRSTSSPSTRPSASSPDAEAIEAAQSADYVTFTSSSTVTQPDRGARRPLPQRRPHRLDRPGHQRGRPRRRPRGRRRGRAPRRRRPPRASSPTLRMTDVGTNRDELRHSPPPLPRTDSTNTRARELAAAGAPHGTVVTAAEQTAGRGRQGRTWTAPPAKPSSTRRSSAPSRSATLLLPLAVPLAVCEAAEELQPGSRLQGQVAQRHLRRRPQAGRSPDRGPPPGRLGSDRHRPQPHDRARRVPARAPRHGDLALRRRSRTQERGSAGPSRCCPPDPLS